MSLGIYAKSTQNVPKFQIFLLPISDVLITISSIFVMYFVRTGGDQDF